MPENRNIKITVEVDGKVVPLDTISTETFEKIKEAAKPKEIPAVRVAIACPFGLSEKPDRVIFKITSQIANCVGKFIAIDVEDGRYAMSWLPGDDEATIKTFYGNTAVPIQDVLDD